MKKKTKVCIDCGTKIYLYSEARCRSCASKEKWRRLNYRINMIAKLKTGINFPLCKKCNKKLTRYGYKFCRKHWSEYVSKAGLVSGKKNPMYIHGQSYNPYPRNFNKQLKRKIFIRDHFTCQKCTKYPNNSLVVHHIDYTKTNCKENNLISLCQKCNLKVNYDRDYWYAYFTYLRRQQ